MPMPKNLARLKKEKNDDGEKFENECLYESETTLVACIKIKNMHCMRL
jgi:hypothetical protein